MWTAAKRANNNVIIYHIAERDFSATCCGKGDEREARDDDVRFRAKSVRYVDVVYDDAMTCLIHEVFRLSTCHSRLLSTLYFDSELLIWCPWKREFPF